MNDKILLELLRAKDKRAACQKQMIEKFHNTIISFFFKCARRRKNFSRNT